MGFDKVVWVLHAEKYFGVSVPVESAEKAVTVEQFALVLWELQTNRPAPLSYDNVLVQLQQLMAHKFNIPIAHIAPTARFMEDLGLDKQEPLRDYILRLLVRSRGAGPALAAILVALLGNLIFVILLLVGRGDLVPMEYHSLVKLFFWK